MNHDRLQQLMMAALDGEIDSAGQRELDDALRREPAARAEWERLRRLKEVTRTMTLHSPPDRVWQEYWSSVYSRIERGASWILISAGAIVLLSWGAWQALRELVQTPETPWFVKGAILALVIGFVALLVSVIREKLFVRRRDPYKDVMR